jgi:hypothetical protein
MPVTAKMTAMITAKPSHPNQVISFIPPSAQDIPSGRCSFSMLQSRHLPSYLRLISMPSLVPLWETPDHDDGSNQYYDSDYYPRNADAGKQNSLFPERDQNTTDEHDLTDKIHACQFHDEYPLDYKLSNMLYTAH